MQPEAETHDPAARVPGHSEIAALEADLDLVDAALDAIDRESLDDVDGHIAALERSRPAAPHLGGSPRPDAS